VAEREHRFDASMKLWRAHRAAVLLLFVGLLGVTTMAWGQFANQTGNVVGTVGGACNSGLNDYAWPDTNGNILKCVSSVWTLVTQPATAAGSTGYVQFNNGGVLAGSANHFWDNTNNRLGIGTTSPQFALQVTSATQFNGIALTNGPNSVATLTGISGTNDAGSLKLFTGGAAQVNINAGGASYFKGGNVGIGSASPVASLDLSQKTDALALPVGTTGQEPASPLNGMIRYNTTLGDIEAYIAGAWTTLTTGGPAAQITLGTSAATPDPARSGEPTTGLFSPASGDVSVSSTGNEIMRVTGTGVSIGTTYVSTAAPSNGMIVQGNVGIGTTNPGATFTMVGSNGSTSGSDNLRIYDANGILRTDLTGEGIQVWHLNNGSGEVGTILYTTPSAFPGIAFENTSGTGRSEIRQLVSTGGLAFGAETGSSAFVNQMVLTTAGFVGIGTQAPLSSLSVAGGAAIGAYGGGVSTTAAPSNGLIVSGSVGIGTTSPANALDVNGGMALGSYAGTATTSGNLIASGSIGIGTNSPPVRLDVRTGNNTNIDFRNTGSTPQLYSVNDANGAYGLLDIDASTLALNAISGGNVGIGTTVPAYLLHVGSASASGIVAEFQNSSGNCTFQPSSSALQVICSSDRRLKEDIDDAVPALPQLADMRVRNYTIKASGERTIGVIAQEMIWKHPDMVHMGPDGYYGVEAPNVWLLVKAIQELMSPMTTSQPA
jgi:hypothetical protein